MLKYTFLFNLDNVSNDQIVYVKNLDNGDKQYLQVRYERDFGRKPLLYIYFTNTLRDASVFDGEISEDVFKEFACIDIKGVLSSLEVVKVNVIHKQNL